MSQGAVFDSQRGELRVSCVEYEGQVLEAWLTRLPSGQFKLNKTTETSEDCLGARTTASREGDADIPYVKITGKKPQKVKLQRADSGDWIYDLVNFEDTGAGRLVVQFGKQSDTRKKPDNVGNQGNNGNNSDKLKGNAAPQDITAAVLKVRAVEITGGGNGRQVVGGAREVDLLNVVNGGIEGLADIVLPEGRFGQLHLILDEGSYVIADGETYPLTVPSGEQSGLKIHGNWGVEGGMITRIELDFSADDIRFNKAQGYRIKPTIKVTAQTEVPFDPSEGDPDILDTGNFSGGAISSLVETSSEYILSADDKAVLNLPKSAITQEIANSLYIEENVRELDLSSNFNIIPDGTEFMQPGILTLKYNPEFLHPNYFEDDLVIFQNGLPIPSIVDSSAKTVEAEISHLSYYRVCHSGCAFTDLAINNQDYDSFKKSVDDIYLLCGLGVLQGYTENGVKLYKPIQEATLVEVLKVLIYTADYQRVKNVTIADPWYQFFLDEAQVKLNLTVSNDEFTRVVSNSEAIGYASSLLGHDVLALAPGLSQTGNITRSQLAELGSILITYTWMGDEKAIEFCDLQSRSRDLRAGTCSGTLYEYDREKAVSYAVNNYKRTYGDGEDENPFGNYETYCGTDPDGSPKCNNCTHFAGQSVLAGLVGSSSAWDVYNSRGSYADKGYPANDWYFENLEDRAVPEWAGANGFLKYVKKQIAQETSFLAKGKTLTGMHFKDVTHDTAEEFMDYGSVQIGDIVFADWPRNDKGDIDPEGKIDGIIDHSMIVTNIQGWRWGYNEIRLTYQSSNKTNVGLGDLNEKYNYKALFYVYRPTHFVK